MAPFIAAVATSAVGSPIPPAATWGRRLSLWAGGTLAAFLLWILALHYFAQKPWNTGWVLGGIVTSPVVNWLLTSSLRSRQAVRDLTRRLGAWRVGWRWYAFAVLFWPAA